MESLHAKAPRRRSQRGSLAIEFALVMLVVVPLFFGTVVMGITIGRAEEATQVTRDVGHMYSEGIDFTTTAAQNLAAKLATGFDLTAGTGDTAMIFSQISTLFAADCTAASVNPCTNDGQGVIKQRVSFGNTSLLTSAFGTPTSTFEDPEGNISAANYMQQSSCVATGWTSIITQNDNDVAYVLEAYYKMPDLSFLSSGYSAKSASGGFYARTIY